MKTGKMKNYILVAFLSLQALTCFAQTDYYTHNYRSYFGRSLYGNDLWASYNRKGLFSDTSFIHKVKFKTITHYVYESEDSILQHKKFKFKTQTTYNSEGEPILMVKTDDNGKVLNSHTQQFDSKGRKVSEREYESDDNIITYTDTIIYNDAARSQEEFSHRVYVYSSGDRSVSNSHTKDLYDEYGNHIDELEYDTNDVATIDRKYTYDAHNQMISSTTLTPTFDEQTGKYSWYRPIGNTEHYKYDAAGNIIETVTDSAGVAIEVETEAYNSKGEEVYDKDVDHGFVVELDITVYNKDGGWTETDENFDMDENDNGKACLDDDKETTTYDKDGNELSDIEIEKDGGETDITKSFTKYKFSKGKIVSEVETEIEKGDGDYSKTVTTTTYKYDERGNRIEKDVDGGGRYGSTTKETYTYNAQNKRTGEMDFSACSYGTPDKTYTIVYYPDGVTIKEKSDCTTRDKNSNTEYYSQNGLMTKTIYRGESSLTENTWEYDLY